MELDELEAWVRGAKSISSSKGAIGAKVHRDVVSCLMGSGLWVGSQTRCQFPEVTLWSLRNCEELFDQQKMSW